jgi:K+-sensing histidine kinase KdpD
MLLVHEHNQSDDTFIQSAIQLCHALGARPIVLTIARSERDAIIRGRALQKSLAAQGLSSEFDQFVGPGPAPAVLRIAAWRRCQVIVLRQPAQRGWWPWGRADLVNQLTAERSSVAFLVLPEEGRRLSHPERPSACG